MPVQRSTDARGVAPSPVPNDSISGTARQTAVSTWYGCGGAKNDSAEIVILGGPARNASYVTKIGVEINAKLPNAVIVESAGDNLDGATWIAQNMHKDAPPLMLWAR